MPMEEKYYTLAVHNGYHPDPLTGAVMPPIVQSSTFAQKEPGVHQGFDYSRADNPTRKILETALAALEGCPYALAFASGLAAEQAIIQTLPEPTEVLVSDDVYGGTGRLFRRLFEKYGFVFKFIDMGNLDNVRSALSSKTGLIWLETPSNPLLKVIDIAAIATLAKSAGKHCKVVVDNTFASPIFQKPLALGADIVIHSTTKYIGGHSDLIGGALMCKDKDTYEALKFVQFAAGAVPSPMECFLLHRSIKTLALRMQKHESNAQEIVSFLLGHPKIERVFYPGLKEHYNHAIAKKQMSGYSGMLSFAWKGSYDTVLTMLARLKLFTLAESLGGVESLINHPERMTHASVPEAQRRLLGIGPNLLRISAGIESSTDLIEDLKQAMQ